MNILFLEVVVVYRKNGTKSWLEKKAQQTSTRAPTPIRGTPSKRKVSTTPKYLQSISFVCLSGSHEGNSETARSLTLCSAKFTFCVGSLKASRNLWISFWFGRVVRVCVVSLQHELDKLFTERKCLVEMLLGLLFAKYKCRR